MPQDLATLTIQLPRELLNEVRKRARATDMTVSQLVRRLLREEIDRG